MSKKKLKGRQRSKQTDDFEDIQPAIESNLSLSFTIRQKFQLSDRQKQFVEKMMAPDTNVVFCEGPAGTAKSYCAVYAGLRLLKERKINEIIYVRSIVESGSKKMGSLPGEVEDKFRPWMTPLIEKCDELIGSHITNDLIKEKALRGVPVNLIRGGTFMNAFVIVDESQNFDSDELTTIMTRIGSNSKIIFLGDARQSDIHRRAFSKFFTGFSTVVCLEKGIKNQIFDTTDIKRHPLLQFIIERIDEILQS